MGGLQKALVLILVTALLSESLLVVSVQAQPTVDWWPMFHHDLAHNGYSTSAVPSTNQTLWSHTVGSFIQSSPAVADGIVYVGAYDGNVYALDAYTGAQVWNYITGSWVSSSPAVAGGIVYIGSMDNKVYAVNASTGALVWNYTTGGPVNSSPVAVAGDIVCVGSYDNNIYCLDASTGAHMWNYTTGGAVESSPAVAGGLVCVGSYDGNVYALDAYKGVLVWNYTTGSSITSSPAVAGGIVYIGSSNSKVYALSESTGALVWNYTTGGAVESSPAVAGGLVYVGSYDKQVYALSASTGALVWNYTTGSNIDSSPAVAGGLVYVGSWDDNVYALDAYTGSLVWSYKTGYFINSSPAVADGKVYVSSNDYSVYAFGLSGPLASFAVDALTFPLIAHQSFNITVTAEDALYNVVTGYTGTVHFSSSDSLAVLPADYTFTTSDNGVHTFPITFNTAGSQDLKVSDLASSVSSTPAWTVSGLAIINNVDIPPGSDWNYSILANSTVVEDFTLPAGGGNITFSDPVFLEGGGLFNITATPKFGYTTDISIQPYEDYSHEAVVGDFNATFYLATEARASVTITFTNAAMSAVAVQSTDLTPPKDVEYSIPPLIPVPVQSTWNVDINKDNRQDLVLGKPMTILVNFTGVTLQSTDSIQVSVSFEGNQYTQITSGTALAKNSILYFPPTAPKTLVPGILGNDIITGSYSINSGVAKSLSTMNVTVKNTAAPSLYYAYLSNSVYGTESETAYNQMVGNSSAFLNATYPVKNVIVSAPYSSASIAGASPGTKKDPYAGMRTDAMAVARKAQLAMGGSAVGIAIGPNGTSTYYFAYQGFPGGAGISFGPNCKGVVVLDGYYTVPSHETGHTYGLYYGIPEEYNSYPPNGQTASGVWPQNVQWRTGYDFMGVAPYKTLNLTWINANTYSMLFNQTRTIPNDPPDILLASGIIYENGTVDTSTLTWYHMQQGTPDTLIPGTYALQFLDANNNVIGTTSFAASFDVHIDPGISVGQNQLDLSSFGTVHVDAAPFVFATTFPQGTATVKIVNFTSPDPQVPPKELTTVPVSEIVNYGTFAEGYLTDGDFNPIDSFECVFTPSTGSNYKMAATNPGTFYYNLKITNYNPTASFNIEVNIPLDFVLKPLSPGASAVQIDGQPVTYQFSSGLLTVNNIQINQGQAIILTVHLDYGLKFQYGRPQPYNSTSQTTFAKGYTFGATVNSMHVAPAAVAAVGKKVTAIGGFLIDTNGFPKGGLTVAAINSGGSTVGTTTSTSDGFYFITLPAAGTYKVRITDSLNTLVGQASNIKVANNQFVLRDFNNLNPADPAITGFVRDESSNGVSGVQVQLLDGKGRPVATTTTNLGGYYTFRFHQPGQYTVQITVPTGYSATTTSARIDVKQFQTVNINLNLKRSNP